MTAVADPTFSPTSGHKFITGTTVQIGTATTSTVLYYTEDMSAPVGTSAPWVSIAVANTGIGKVSVATPTPGQTIAFRAYATKSGLDDSAVVTARYGGLGFSSGVTTQNLAMVDLGSSNLLGSTTQGIGAQVALAATYSTSSIGGATGTQIAGEYNAGNP